MKGTPAEPQCGFSRAAVQVLELQGVPQEKLQTYNVLADQELREGIKKFSCVCFISDPCVCLRSHVSCFGCREWPTIPQIYVNGEFVGGCDILLSSESCGFIKTTIKRV